MDGEDPTSLGLVPLRDTAMQGSGLLVDCYVFRPGIVIAFTSCTSLAGVCCLILKLVDPSFVLGFSLLDLMHKCVDCAIPFLMCTVYAIMDID
jgi:hypothetical protein